jgi:tetratricopeptide (TPR) repeat protein
MPSVPLYPPNQFTGALMQTNNDEIRWLFDRADELLDSHRATEALALYEQIVDRDPQQHEAWMMLGSLLGESGEAERGLECLRKAVELKPDYAHGHYILGYALRVLGKIDEAVRHFQAACQYDAEDPEYKLALGKMKLEAGKLDEATSLMGQAFAQGAGDVKDQYLLASALYQSGDLAGAANAYRQVLAADAQHHDATRHLSTVLTSLNRHEEAETALAEAIKRLGGSPDLHHQYATVLLQQGKYSEALKQCTLALEIDPENEKLMTVQAEALQAIGDYEKALDVLRPMLEAERVPVGAVLVFAKLSTTFDMREEAKALLDKLDRGPDLNEHERAELAKAKAYLQEH